MYTNKKNILQLVSLLQSYGINHVVLSPGSRNAPIIHTVAKHPYFHCHTVVDERSAAFLAIGMIQKLQQPVAICCTSGTALLNYGSGVAEAYYQQLPLLVISADRPQAWINQMDGQTLPQPGIFGPLVKKSVQLPEVNTQEDEWYCNRLINEALTALTLHGRGPVHINVPLSEPLFDFSTEEIPAQRRIRYYPSVSTRQQPYRRLIHNWNTYARRMIIVGQATFPADTRKELSSLAQQHNCVVVAEHTGNIPFADVIHNSDTLLYTLAAEEKAQFAPEMVITLGGHIVSKRIKQLLRAYPPAKHWHIGENGGIPDLFRSLTDVVEEDPYEIVSQLAHLPDYEKDAPPAPFYTRWHERSREVATQLKKQAETLPYSDLAVMKAITSALPPGSVLHLANSSPVRNAQLFPLPDRTEVFCNRGMSGIDGSLSTAVGYATVHDGPVFLVIGDLSYLYDFNIQLNSPLPPNLRIFVIDNAGGEIFRLLPGLNKSDMLEQYICQRQPERTLSATVAIHRPVEMETVDRKIRRFIDNPPGSDNTPILYIVTSGKENTQTFKQFYHQLKNISYGKKVEND